MNEPALHLKRRQPPKCWSCGATTKQQVVAHENWNGNAGRSMYRCSECDRFVCFADTRGIHLDNPRCNCPKQPLSRAQVAGDTEKQEIPRAVHYRCAMGMCSFFEYKEDEEGEVVTLRQGRLNPEEVRVMGL